MKARYVILCDAHSQQGSKHSYYGVFDRIMAQKFPCVQGKMHLGIELEGPAEEERPISIAFLDSQGRPILPEVKGIRITFSNYQTASIQIDLKGVRFPIEGFYSVVVRHKGRVVGERMIFVEKIVTKG